jgi:predicted nuclease of predicted toxin-antitoxin system
VKLIIDENLPPSWVAYLTPAGHEPLHWRQIGKPGDPDEIIFQYAKENACIILSQDLDFTRMLALSGESLPSVIQLRVDCPLPEHIGKEVLFVLESFASELNSGCLVSIDIDTRRLRLLPLHKKAGES